MEQAKIDAILELLPKCPKTAAVLPCSIGNFRKMIPILDDDIIEKIYQAVVLESKLTQDK